MISRWSLKDSITPYFRITTDTGQGQEESWNPSTTLKGNVKDAGDDEFFPPRIASNSEVRSFFDVTLRGRRDWNYQDVRFYWENGAKWLRPRKPSLIPGLRNSKFSIWKCEEITDLAIDNPESVS